jgi:hypothetical protein
MFSIFHLINGRPPAHHGGLSPWDPQQRAALLHDVCTAMRLGYFAEAQAMLNHEPHATSDAACLNLLGVIHELRQQWKLAHKHYRWSVRRDPAYAPARQNIRRLYELETFGRTANGIALGDERPALGNLLQARQRFGLIEDCATSAR